MLGSLGFVLGLCGYCFARVLSKPAAADHMHAPLEIESEVAHQDRKRSK